MRILKLMGRFPYPPISGGQLRDYNLLRRLARHEEIALFAMVDSYPPQDALDHVRQYCSEVFLVEGGHKTVSAGLGNILEPVPYHVTSYRNRSLKRAVDRHVAQRDVDVVDATLIHMTQYYPEKCGPIRVLDQQNADRVVWGRLAATHPSPLMRVFSHINLAKLKWYESKIYPTLGLAVSVSREDLEVTKSFAPEGLALHLAPNGVDTAFFAPSSECVEEPERLLICGGMNQLATVDAALSFVAEVWPGIRQRHPDAQLWLVGRDPVATIRALAGQNGIAVTGTVPDVRPFYARASVVLAPYRLGGGTKLKVLNAMSMGKAVVATSVGAQGIEVDGDSVVVADSPGEYVLWVLRLLEDDALRRQIGAAAREEMLRKYDWDGIARGYAAALEEAVERKRRSRARPSL